ASSVTRTLFQHEEPKWIATKPILSDRWDACVMTLETNTNVPLVSWSPNSTQLASADDQKQIKIWNPTTSQCIATLIGHEGWVLSVAWSPNSALIASGSED